MIKFKFYILFLMVGSLLQAFGQGLNFIQSSKANDDAIYAQQQENEKNRRYNFMLAQKQNEWNLQQWERSNEYNNPLNQVARLKNAGLNPNLVYGNGAGQSVAAPNPQMTSGAPSTPQDMSLIAQRPTVGQAMTQALQNRAVQAQIEKTEADTRKTNADAGISESDLKYRDAWNALGIDEKYHDVNLKSQSAARAVEEFNKLKIDIEHSKVALEGMKLDVFRKKMENSFREKEMQEILRKLCAEADISENDAKFAIESYASRLLLSNSTASIAADNASIPEFLNDVKNKNKIGEIGATLFQGIRYLLGFINPLL